MNATPFDVNSPLIRAPMLRRALISGARRVIAQRDWLNGVYLGQYFDGRAESKSQ